MTTEPNRRRNNPAEPNRRRNNPAEPIHQPRLAGVPVRENDIEPTLGLHWVAWLCRALAVLLFLLMVVQIALGVTSAVEISYGVLFAEGVRLLIFAGMLWGAGAPARPRRLHAPGAPSAG